MSAHYLATHSSTMIATETRSPHNRILVLLLAIFFGVLGIHRFAVGKVWTGLFLLFTGGGFGFWWLIDIFMILLGRFTDSEGRVLGPPQIKRVISKPPAPRLPAKPVEPAVDMDFSIDPLEDKFKDLEKDLAKRR